MARGILEFREGNGAGRSPFKKPRVFEAVLLAVFSHLREVCRPIDNSVAFLGDVCQSLVMDYSITS